LIYRTKSVPHNLTGFVETAEGRTKGA